MMSGHLKNRTHQMHFQCISSFKEKLLTSGVNKFHTATNLFQNISYPNKLVSKYFIPQPTHIFFMTAPQDTETYIQNEVILVLINFACKLRIRFATLFEKTLVFIIQPRSVIVNFKKYLINLISI